MRFGRKLQTFCDNADFSDKASKSRSEIETKRNELTPKYGRGCNRSQIFPSSRDFGQRCCIRKYAQIDQKQIRAFEKF